MPSPMGGDPATTGDVFETVARFAVDGARKGIGACLTDEDAVVVVTVAWHGPDGSPYVIGTAVPEGGHPLLADSLRQSADEAEEASS